MINFPWSKTYVHKCPDGTTRIIHKSVDTVFPLHIQSSSSKTNVEFEGLEGLKGKLNNEYKTKIEGVLYQLNEMNSTLMMKSRNAYALFQGNPCDGYDMFSKEMLKINDEHNKMMVLKIRINGLIDLAGNNGLEALSLYKQMLSLMEDFKVVDTAAIEIKANRELMKKLEDKKDGI